MSDILTRNAAFAKQMADVVQRHVQDALAPLVKRNVELEARIKELESRPLAKDGAPGRDGVDGKDGAAGKDGRDGLFMKNHVVNSDGVLVLTMSDGSNVVTGIRSGRDGRDGQSVTVEDIRPVLREMVDAFPKPQDGKNGRDGADGKDGAPGRDGVDGKSVAIDDVLPAIHAEIEKRFATIPTPKDGRDGMDGKDGLPGPKGEKGSDGNDGADGRNGVDGRNGTDADPDLIGRMVAEKVAAIPVLKGERGQDGAPGRDGKDGKDGVDGKDGACGKDADTHAIADILLPEIKTFLLSNASFKGDPGIPGRDGRDGAPGGPPGPKGEKGDPGEPGKSIIYRGIYKPGLQAAEGDVVTFGGSGWIAKRDTDEKPGQGDAWQLMVKRGADGKDGK